jgi:hypothetical protein
VSHLPTLFRCFPLSSEALTNPPQSFPLLLAIPVVTRQAGLSFSAPTRTRPCKAHPPYALPNPKRPARPPPPITSEPPTMSTPGISGARRSSRPTDRKGRIRTSPSDRELHLLLSLPHIDAPFTFFLFSRCTYVLFFLDLLCTSRRRSLPHSFDFFLSFPSPLLTFLPQLHLYKTTIAYTEIQESTKIVRSMSYEILSGLTDGESPRLISAGVGVRTTRIMSSFVWSMALCQTVSGTAT